MEGKHYVGEVGTDVIVDCGCNIEEATIRQLRVKKPDNTIVTWNADIEGTNFLKYATIEADFSVVGDYKIQAFVNIPFWSGRGETATFTISKDFE